MELAYTLDLKSSAFGLVGSSPTGATKKGMMMIEDFLEQLDEEPEESSDSIFWALIHGVSLAITVLAGLILVAALSIIVTGVMLLFLLELSE